MRHLKNQDTMEPRGVIDTDFVYKLDAELRTKLGILIDDFSVHDFERGLTMINSIAAKIDRTIISELEYEVEGVTTGSSVSKSFDILRGEIRIFILTGYLTGDQNSIRQEGYIATRYGATSSQIMSLHPQDFYLRVIRGKSGASFDVLRQKFLFKESHGVETTQKRWYDNGVIE